MYYRVKHSITGIYNINRVLKTARLLCKQVQYCHVLVTKHGVWIGNWIRYL